MQKAPGYNKLCSEYDRLYSVGKVVSEGIRIVSLFYLLELYTRKV
jgi:hypothetical protein